MPQGRKKSKSSTEKSGWTLLDGKRKMSKVKNGQIVKGPKARKGSKKCPPNAVIARTQKALRRKLGLGGSSKNVRSKSGGIRKTRARSYKSKPKSLGGAFGRARLDSSFMQAIEDAAGHKIKTGWIACPDAEDDEKWKICKVIRFKLEDEEYNVVKRIDDGEADYFQLGEDTKYVRKNKDDARADAVKFFLAGKLGLSDVWDEGILPEDTEKIEEYFPSYSTLTGEDGDSGSGLGKLGASGGGGLFGRFVDTEDWGVDPKSSQLVRRPKGKRMGKGAGRYSKMAVQSMPESLYRYTERELMDRARNVGQLRKGGEKLGFPGMPKLPPYKYDKYGRVVDIKYPKVVFREEGQEPMFPLEAEDFPGTGPMAKEGMKRQKAFEEKWKKKKESKFGFGYGGDDGLYHLASGFGSSGFPSSFGFALTDYIPGVEASTLFGGANDEMRFGRLHFGLKRRRHLSRRNRCGKNGYGTMNYGFSRYF
jgi:hypothetical protein